jgi:transcriptional regulator with XRE-family HTH domain
MGRKPKTENHKNKTLSRYLKGKSYTEFAKLIEISPQHLSSILFGHRKPSLKVAIRMSVVSDGKLNLKNMRPDIYRELMKNAEVEKT